MKKYILLIFLAAGITMTISCRKYPVDEKGLLITDNTTCYMSSFNLLGSDNQTVLVTIPTFANGLIDTVKGTVTATAKFGTNITKVKPYCSLGANDMLVDPFMGQWTDFTQPKTFTLISGTRKIKKVYTITVTVQQ
ncbi:hypothetical protein [Mucilaginibacter segetis]|uniref:Glycoside hydrolase xylanase family protein n=1 Tax=Mucilaginibacter segetis TaxID=2793071 RepID=A0A934UMJ1_9SPHI|nr:hypothetical protein [Mucilaginibacter segetis]MBK0379703.1 hypothetical protein [Mucilaginibacter segetis]